MRPLPALFSFLFVIIFATVGTAQAQDDTRPTDAQWSAFARTLATDVIQPAYAHLRIATEAFEAQLEALCAAPSPAQLAQVRQSYGHVIAAFGQASVIRFGPIRRDTRLERMMHWPDPRGRSLRQIQSLLTNEDPTALDVTTLAQKSVAVQGLIAQDYLLFGQGSEHLSSAENSEGRSYRCQYAHTSTTLLHSIAHETATEWDGYITLFTTAGPDNPDFKSPAEVGQRVVGTALESLQLLSDQHLKAVLRDSPVAAKPKRSAFWRSNQSLTYLTGVLAGINAISTTPAWEALQNDTLTAALERVNTELSLGQRIYDGLADQDQDWLSLAQSDTGHAQLLVSTFNLDGAKLHYETSVLAALGLNPGFNSLDGD